MMRKANGNLHFYINGLDQGVAATRVGNQMWGVVDLYGMTVKVTIGRPMISIYNNYGAQTDFQITSLEGSQL